MFKAIRERVLNATRIYDNQLNYLKVELLFSIVGQPLDFNQNLKITATYDNNDIPLEIITGILISSQNYH